MLPPDAKIKPGTFAEFKLSAPSSAVESQMAAYKKILDEAMAGYGKSIAQAAKEAGLTLGPIQLGDKLHEADALGAYYTVTPTFTNNGDKPVTIDAVGMAKLPTSVTLQPGDVLNLTENVHISQKDLESADHPTEAIAKALDAKLGPAQSVKQLEEAATKPGDLATKTPASQMKAMADYIKAKYPSPKPSAKLTTVEEDFEALTKAAWPGGATVKPGFWSAEYQPYTEKGVPIHQGHPKLHKAADADAEDIEKLMAPEVKEPSPVDTTKAHELAEAAIVWDQGKHPRWPPHTFDYEGHDIGGQFMRAGETFMADGQRWEIHSIADGHIIANNAEGTLKDAKTRVFDPVTAQFPDGPHPTIQVAGVAKTTKITSGKGKVASQYTSPIVDATHGNAGPHDPSIKLPANSELSEQDWLKFGRADQLYYREVMSRYGKWTHGGKSLKAGSDFLHSKAAAEVKKVGNPSAQTIVTSAFQGQKGSSKGYELDLATAWHSAGSDPGSLAKARKLYEEAREAEQAVNGVIAWDLYNRLRSPDISLLHKNSQSDNWWSEVIAGKAPMMSGLSSTWTTGVWHEPNTFAYALPIRHLAMATDIVGWAGGYGGEGGEHEMANANRVKLSPETATFWSKVNTQVFKWLSDQITKHPKGGHVVRDLAGHLAGTKDLPLPEAESDFTVLHKPGEKTYTIPPDSFMHHVEDSIAADPGNVVSGYEPIVNLNLKPGDIIATKDTSTRYLVIADSGASTGMSYLALQKGPFGNYDSQGEKKYTFSSMSAKRYKVDKHFDIPQPPKKPLKAITHNPAQWKPTGQKVKVNTLAVGDMIRVNGDDWQIVNKSTTTTTIKSMTSDSEATVNSLWKTQKLAQANIQPQKGDLVRVSDPTAGEPFLGIVKHGDKLASDVVKPDGGLWTGANEHLTEVDALPTLTPAKGDTFSSEGVKHTVTSVLKNGTVRARPQTGGAVKLFQPDDPDLKLLVRPADYALGAKQKLGTLEPGTLVSGSPSVVRPYMVMGKSGKTTYLKNLDTGALAEITNLKSYNLLVHKDEAEAQPTAYDIPHDQWTVGMTVPTDGLEEGDKFTKDGELYTVTVVGSDLFQVKLPNGSVQAMTKGGQVEYAGKDTGKEPDSVTTFQQLVAGDSFGWNGNKYTVQAVSGGQLQCKDLNSGEVLTFHATPQKVKIIPTPSAPPAAQIDSNDLPEAPISAYKWHKSGTHKYFKIESLADGVAGGKASLFTDKAGKVWKVKQAGAQVIVTDGQNLYKAPGHLFVNATPDAAFNDQSPPLGGVEKQVYDAMTDNGDGATLDELGLDQPGSHIWTGGKSWTLDNNGYWVAPDGSKTGYSGGMVPQKYTVGAGAWQTTGDLETASAKKQDLQPGDQFKTKADGPVFTLLGIDNSPQGPQFAKKVVAADENGVVSSWGDPHVVAYKKQPNDKTPNMVTAADLKLGDHFQYAGNEYELTQEPSPGHAAIVKSLDSANQPEIPWGGVNKPPPVTVTKLTPKAQPGTIGALGAGQQFDLGDKTYTVWDGQIHSVPNNFPLVVVKDPDGNMMTLPAQQAIGAPQAKVEGTAPPGGPIPFKWHKGGGGTHNTKLGTLIVGDSFHDKQGKEYTVVHPGVDSSVIVDDKGEQYTIPHVHEGKPFWVKMLSSGNAVPEYKSPAAFEEVPPLADQPYTSPYKPGDMVAYATDSGMKVATIASDVSPSVTQHAYVMDNGEKVDGNSISGPTGEGTSWGSLKVGDKFIVNAPGDPHNVSQFVYEVVGETKKQWKVKGPSGTSNVNKNADQSTVTLIGGHKKQIVDLTVGTTFNVPAGDDDKTYGEGSFWGDKPGPYTILNKSDSGAITFQDSNGNKWTASSSSPVALSLVPYERPPEQGTPLQNLEVGTVFKAPDHPWFTKKGEPVGDDWQIVSKSTSPKTFQLKPVHGTGKSYTAWYSSEIGDIKVQKTPPQGTVASQMIAPGGGTSVFNAFAAGFPAKDEGAGFESKHVIIGGTNALQLVAPNGQVLATSKHGKVYISDTTPVLWSQALQQIIKDASPPIHDGINIGPPEQMPVPDESELGFSQHIPPGFIPNTQGYPVSALPAGVLYPTGTGKFGFNVKKILDPKAGTVQTKDGGTQTLPDKGYVPTHIKLPPDVSTWGDLPVGAIVQTKAGTIIQKVQPAGKNTAEWKVMNKAIVYQDSNGYHKGDEYYTGSSNNLYSVISNVDPDGLVKPEGAKYKKGQLVALKDMKPGDVFTVLADPDHWDSTMQWTVQGDQNVPGQVPLVVTHDPDGKLTGQETTDGGGTKGYIIAGPSVEGSSGPGDLATPVGKVVGQLVKAHELEVGDMFENDEGGLFQADAVQNGKVIFHKLKGPGTELGNMDQNTPVAYKFMGNAGPDSTLREIKPPAALKSKATHWMNQHQIGMQVKQQIHKAAIEWKQKDPKLSWGEAYKYAAGDHIPSSHPAQDIHATIQTTVDGKTKPGPVAVVPLNIADAADNWMTGSLYPQTVKDDIHHEAGKYYHQHPDKGWGNAYKNAQMIVTGGTDYQGSALQLGGTVQKAEQATGEDDELSKALAQSLEQMGVTRASSAAKGADGKDIFTGETVYSTQNPGTPYEVTGFSGDEVTVKAPQGGTFKVSAGILTHTPSTEDDIPQYMQLKSIPGINTIPMQSAGPPVHAQDLPTFAVAQKKNGLLVQKQPNGSWYPIGGEDKADPLKTGLVTPVTYKLPDLNDAVKTGNTKAASDYQPGESFWFNNKAYTIIGKGAKNAHAQLVASGGHNPESPTSILILHAHQMKQPLEMVRFPHPDDDEDQPAPPEPPAGYKEKAGAYLASQGYSEPQIAQIHQDAANEVGLSAAVKEGNGPTANTWAAGYSVAANQLDHPPAGAKITYAADIKDALLGTSTPGASPLEDLVDKFLHGTEGKYGDHWQVEKQPGGGWSLNHVAYGATLPIMYRAPNGDIYTTGAKFKDEVRAPIEKMLDLYPQMHHIGLDQTSLENKIKEDAGVPEGGVNFNKLEVGQYFKDEAGQILQKSSPYDATVFAFGEKAGHTEKGMFDQVTPVPQDEAENELQLGKPDRGLTVTGAEGKILKLAPPDILHAADEHFKALDLPTPERQGIHHEAAAIKKDHPATSWADAYGTAWKEVKGQQKGKAAMIHAIEPAEKQVVKDAFKAIGDSIEKAGAASKQTAEKMKQLGDAMKGVGWVPDYSETDLKGGTAAGGSTGAKIMTDPDGGKWLLKAYGGNQDRVSTELLANRIYHVLGIDSPEAGTYMVGNKQALAYPLRDGHISQTWTAQMKKKFAQGYVADALLGSYDHIGLERDNVLWDGGDPIRVDQGGTFLYRAQGKKKEYAPQIPELTSMLKQGQAGQMGLGEHLTEQDIRHQAADIVGKLTPAKVDQMIANLAWDNVTDKGKIKSSLLSRLDQLGKIAAGGPLPPGLTPLLKG